MIRAYIGLHDIIIPRGNLRDFEDANELFAYIEEQLVREKVRDTVIVEWFGREDESTDVYITVDNTSMKFGLNWRKKKVFRGRGKKKQ